MLGRWQQVCAVEAAGAVDVGGVHGAPGEGLGGAGVDGDAGAGEGDEEAGGVGGGLRERGVAVHGADAEEGDGGVVGAEEDGEGVLEESIRALEIRVSKSSM